MKEDVVDLYFSDGSHRVYAGSCPPKDVEELESAWKKAGWLRVGLSEKRAVSKRRAARLPFEPARCPLCDWAGLNLGVHHHRVHPGRELSVAATAPMARDQAGRARRQVEKARKPRAGMLVVRETRGTWEVWKIERVNASTITMTDGEVTVQIDEGTLRRSFRPVGRWPRG